MARIRFSVSPPAFSDSSATAAHSRCHAVRAPLVISVRAVVALLFAWALILVVPGATAQPTPQPQDCSCSPGVNLGSEEKPVIIRHCQCGILTCVVVVSSGQLQCGR